MDKIIIFIIIVAFFHLGYKKSPNGLFLIIFLLPYEGIEWRNMQLSTFAILSYFIGNTLHRNIDIGNLFKNNIYKRYIIVLILLFVFGILNFLIRGFNSDFLLYYGESVENAFLSYIINFITSILLFLLIFNNITTFYELKKCLSSFVLSIFYVFFTWLFDFLLNLDIPTFLKTLYSGGDRYLTIVPTFAGYTGETGLTAEYTLFILSFSLYLFLSSKNLNKKLFYLFIMIISILIGISTLMKTYYFALAIMLFVISYFFLKEKNISLNKKASIFGIIIILVSFVFWKASNSYIVTRFANQIERTQSVGSSEYKFDAMIHRPYVEEFNNFWEVCGLIGIGSINALGVRGNHLATHSLYFDLFMKFGLIGLFIYLIFYFRLLMGLYRLSKSKYQMPNNSKQLIYILFSLFFSLLFAQYARSYQDQTSSMLMYWFLFAIIACVNKMKPNLVLNNTNYRKSKKI